MKCCEVTTKNVQIFENLKIAKLVTAQKSHQDFLTTLLRRALLFWVFLKLLKIQKNKSRWCRWDFVLLPIGLIWLIIDLKMTRKTTMKVKNWVISRFNMSLHWDWLAAKRIRSLSDVTYNIRKRFIWDPSCK